MSGLITRKDARCHVPHVIVKHRQRFIETRKLRVWQIAHVSEEITPMNLVQLDYQIVQKGDIGTPTLRLGVVKGLDQLVSYFPLHDGGIPAEMKSHSFQRQFERETHQKKDRGGKFIVKGLSWVFAGERDSRIGMPGSSNEEIFDLLINGYVHIPPVTVSPDRLAHRHIGGRAPDEVAA